MSSTIPVQTPLKAQPTSLFFESHRLRLHYWDYGTADKPPLILVHGGLDHARSWTWVAAELALVTFVFGFATKERR